MMEEGGDEYVNFEFFKFVFTTWLAVLHQQCYICFAENLIQTFALTKILKMDLVTQ